MSREIYEQLAKQEGVYPIPEITDRIMFAALSEISDLRNHVSALEAQATRLRKIEFAAQEYRKVVVNFQLAATHPSHDAAAMITAVTDSGAALDAALDGSGPEVVALDADFEKRVAEGVATYFDREDVCEFDREIADAVLGALRGGKR